MCYPHMVKKHREIKGMALILSIENGICRSQEIKYRNSFPR